MMAADVTATISRINAATIFVGPTVPGRIEAVAVVPLLGDQMAPVMTHIMGLGAMSMAARDRITADVARRIAARGTMHPMSRTAHVTVNPGTAHAPRAAGDAAANGAGATATGRRGQRGRRTRSCARAVDQIPGTRHTRCSIGPNPIGRRRTRDSRSGRGLGPRGPRDTSPRDARPRVVPPRRVSRSRYPRGRSGDPRC